MSLTKRAIFCKNCRKSLLASGNRKFCNRQCCNEYKRKKAIMGVYIRGERMRINNPTHYRQKNGKTPRSWYVYEKHHHIEIDLTNIIHHINFLPHDDHIENLYLTFNNKHLQIHNETEPLLIKFCRKRGLFSDELLNEYHGFLKEKHNYMSVFEFNPYKFEMLGEIMKFNLQRNLTRYIRKESAVLV